MKKLFAIGWKDAIIRFASPWELLFFIILPLVFTFLVAGGTPSGESDNRIPLVVVDEAQSELSKQVIEALDKSTTVGPEVVSRAEADSRFENRRAGVILIIPEELTATAIQEGNAQVEIRQQPNNLDAVVAERAVQTALRGVSGALGAAQAALEEAEANGTFESESERQAYFQESLALAQDIQAQAPERLKVVEGNTPEEEVAYDPRANASAGQLITWVFVPLLGISELFADERQRGTLRRILTTPTSKATYLTGTVAGQVIIALVQMLLLVLFGIFVMKLPWGREPTALFAVMAATALAAGALGTAMGTFIKSPGQASGLSIMAGMVMALMGGCWYPLELFPQAIQQAVKILPTTWAMQGMLDLVLRGGGLVDVLPETAVLLAFAALFLAIGVWRFRYE